MKGWRDDYFLSIDVPLVEEPKGDHPVRVNRRCYIEQFEEYLYVKRFTGQPQVACKD